MTHSEWQNCQDPFGMARYLPASTSTRKMRLYGCAVVRSRWGTLDAYPESRAAVECAEQIADGTYKTFAPYPVSNVLSTEGVQAVARRLVGPVWGADDLNLLLHRGGRGDDPLSLEHCCDLLRDVIGFPKTPAHRQGHEFYWGDGTQQQDWWLTPQVRDLALAAYEERPADGVLDNVRFMVLADALEEAGLQSDRTCMTCMGLGLLDPGPTLEARCPRCRNSLQNEYLPTTSAVVQMRCASCKEVFTPRWCGQCSGRKKVPNPLMAHLRGSGVHVRGCWALDLLLGRK